MKVRELISKRVVSCRDDEPIECAVIKMHAENVGSVLVVDSTESLVGIITERDVIRLVAQGVDLKMPLKSVMTRRVITAEPDEAVSSAAVKMVENNIRHLPVVEGGRVVGVVSIRDVMRALLASAAFP
ncbi:MAG: CBS domain-containing protein [Thermoproteaceae archaeon]|jgi:CBS domain-containing protein|nr:CBS domain-containing protein [Thermoproteaceae archaeon]